MTVGYMNISFCNHHFESHVLHSMDGLFIFVRMGLPKGKIARRENGKSSDVTNRRRDCIARITMQMHSSKNTIKKD